MFCFNGVLVILLLDIKNWIFLLPRSKDHPTSKQGTGITSRPGLQLIKVTSSDSNLIGIVYGKTPQTILVGLGLGLHNLLHF